MVWHRRHWNTCRQVVATVLVWQQGHEAVKISPEKRKPAAPNESVNVAATSKPTQGAAGRRTPTSSPAPRPAARPTPVNTRPPTLRMALLLIVQLPFRKGKNQIKLGYPNFMLPTLCPPVKRSLGRFAQSRDSHSCCHPESARRWFPTSPGAMWRGPAGSHCRTCRSCIWSFGQRLVRSPRPSFQGASQRFLAY